MARTRVDPWQSEPDVSWWGSSLSTIIPKTPRSKSPILSSPSPPYEETSYTAPHTKYLTKPSARFLFNSKSIPPPPVDTKNPLSPPFSSTLTATKPAPKPPPKPTHSNVLFPKSRHRSPLLPSSESKNTNGSSPKLKTLFPRNSISKVTKPKSKVDLEIAATKVITACNDLDHCLFETVSPIKPQKEKNRLELPDGDKRKNMVPRIILRDIGGIISKVCPKLSSAPTSPSSSKSTLLDGSLMSVSPPSTPGSPGSPVLTPISLHSPLLEFKRRTPLITLSDIPMVEPDVPQVFLEPPIGTLEEDPPVLKNSVDSAFNSSFKLTSLRQRKSSFSEKSSTPVSKKSLVFEVLEGVAPSPFKSKLESLLPCSPKSGPAYPLGSVSSVSSKSNIQPDNSIGTVADPAQIKILRSSKNSPLKQSPNSVEAQLVSESGYQAATDSTKLKAAPPLENGFLDFLRKMVNKTRFHVDTNILASSLDLLDLQKHAGNISGGSPTTCCNCNIIFSSVKHCKYHQSATSPGVFDSLRQHTVQEDGVWLCPWCPVMCTTVDFLHKHKLVCREKGRCQQEEKASSSSFRKSAPSSSRRRTCTPAILTNSTTTLPALLKPSNSFRVVHGFVIPA